MRVLKAINNNVVSCVDDSGRELIAMGKGLGFRSRAGDVLRPEDAEKVSTVGEALQLIRESAGSGK